MRPALQRILLACCGGLLLAFTAPLVLGTNASIGFWLMQVVPLLLTVPGVLQHNPRTLQWLGFLVLFYFLNGVLQAASATPLLRWLGMLTVLLCVTLFATVIVAVRSGRNPSRRTE